jgi:hypothetical protein
MNADLRARLDEIDWAAVAGGLDEAGVARVGPVLSPSECESVAGLYDGEGRFRSTVDMARHRYGEGE